MDWNILGVSDTPLLAEARLQAHHAAQVVSAAGATLLENDDDDSAPNLSWHAPSGALACRELPGSGVSLGLVVSNLSLASIDTKGTVRGEQALAGLTLDDAYAEAEALLRQADEPLPPNGLARDRYDLPAHPVAEGRAFEIDMPEPYTELATWFAVAAEVLGVRAGETPRSTEVRVWPHRFDAAFVVPIETDGAGRLAKSISVGLSPGDEDVAEPHWYVSPWPDPDASLREPFGSIGSWSTGESAVARLRRSQWLDVEDEEELRPRLDAFFDAALEASRRALAQTPGAGQEAAEAEDAG